MDKDAVKNEFREKIGRLAQSRAYLDFCEEIYGVRACLLNMMDREQLDYVLHAVPVAPEDTVLDLGYGTGGLLTLIADKYGCAGVGIDLLSPAAMAHDDKMQYICGDIDDIADYSISPTITLSVDSLYFSGDLDKLVRELACIPNNRLYFFYSQYLFDEGEDRRLLKSRGTRLAQALAKAETPFQTLDFGENERRLYVNMEKALKQRERVFAAEGNGELYEQKLREVSLGRQLFEKGCASRYLYIGKPA